MILREWLRRVIEVFATLIHGWNGALPGSRTHCFLGYQMVLATFRLLRTFLNRAHDLPLSPLLLPHLGLLLLPLLNIQLIHVMLESLIVCLLLRAILRNESLYRVVGNPHAMIVFFVNVLHVIVFALCEPRHRSIQKIFLLDFRNALIRLDIFDPRTVTSVHAFVCLGVRAKERPIKQLLLSHFGIDQLGTVE